MKDSLIESVVTIALAIVGVATIAVLVSRNAQTPQLINAAGTAFSRSLSVAEAPVTSVGEFPGANEYF